MPARLLALTARGDVFPATKLISNQFCLSGYLDYDEPPAIEESAEPKHQEIHDTGREHNELFSQQRGNRMQMHDDTRNAFRVGITESTAASLTCAIRGGRGTSPGVPHELG